MDVSDRRRCHQGSTTTVAFGAACFLSNAEFCKSRVQGHYPMYTRTWTGSPAQRQKVADSTRPRVHSGAKCGSRVLLTRPRCDRELGGRHTGLHRVVHVRFRCRPPTKLTKKCGPDDRRHEESNPKPDPNPNPHPNPWGRNGRTQHEGVSVGLRVQKMPGLEAYRKACPHRLPFRHTRAAVL